MNKKGFSLIESIIYMALLSGILLILAQIFTSIIQAKLETEASSSIEQNADYIISRLIYDISRASSIDVPSSYGGSSSSNLQISIGGINYSYVVSGNSLQLTNNLGTDNLSDSSVAVSNLGFTKIGKTVGTSKFDTVRISFRLTSIAKRSSGNEIGNYQITVAPR